MMEEAIEVKHQKVFDMLQMYRREYPDSFFYTLRQTNRNARLDKGYWFLGTEKYLVLSFWKGKDWKNKTPRISFLIFKNGTTRLELWAKDTANKNLYFNRRLIKELNVLSQDDNAGYYKNYNQYSPEDYLLSLQSFIKNEKIIIDRALKNEVCFERADNEKEYIEDIQFISRVEFTAQFINVVNYKRKIYHIIQNSGFLNEIAISNFTPIKNLKIENIPETNRWIFLTGENGSGKTSILKAIATALCQNNDNNKKIAQAFGEFKLNIKMNWGEEIEEHTINFNDESANKTPIPNGIVVYGPIRLLTEGNVNAPFFTIESDSIIECITFGLFNPIGVLRDLSGEYSLFEKAKYLQLAIDNLTENLTKIVPNIEIVTYKGEIPNGELLFYEKRLNGPPNEEGITFDRLPSGTKSFVALILDLLIRFKEQQPEKSDPASYNGIVLIDEIDLHLHPKLQKEIIIQLSATFPKVQFIVTTHSPIPLLGAPDNSIFLKVAMIDGNVTVEKLDDKIPITKLLPNTLLSSPLFDLDDFAPVDKKINELLTEDNYEEALYNYLLKKRFDQYIGRND